MLWALYFRVAEARRDGAFLSDPLGEELVDRISFDFAKFGRINAAHAIRSRFSDDLIRDFLVRHPESTVVALGEGLETQFWRVDNGLANWISVDLPEAISLRERLLPRHPRNKLVPCSALDDSWLRSVDASNPVFVTAAGLLMYFNQADVSSLLQRIVSRFPHLELFFDTIPPWLSRRTQRGHRRTSSYRPPPMPFGIGINDIGGFVSGIEGLRLRRAFAYPEAYPEKMPILNLLCRASWVRAYAPALVHTTASIERVPQT
jgi:O-methyltransferase involved in polyketide biosynthesis